MKNEVLQDQPQGSDTVAAAAYKTWALVVKKEQADLVLQASVALVGKTGRADPLDDIAERLKLAAYTDDPVVLEPLAGTALNSLFQNLGIQLQVAAETDSEGYYYPL